MNPDFSWAQKRGAGVFLHISSLPSEYGIGNVGAAARPFFEFLETAGLGYWQICPLGPTGYGDSPYQSFSSFAGNPYFIDVSELVALGLLRESQLEPLRRLPSDFCDYGGIYGILPKLLRTAYLNWRATGMGDLGFCESFKRFCSRNSFWLDAYSRYVAIKEKFGGKAWLDWPDKYRNFNEAKRVKLSDDDIESAESAKFTQWVFFCQYQNFRKLASEHGIQIFGDIPIYVAPDSADAWSNPQLFKLDEFGNPLFVAGVAPDYFSDKGQLWGNPIYDWSGSKNAVYEFWRLRLKSAFELFDVVRLDHFRGFADYWSIPASAKDAREGKWIKGPGRGFFIFLRKNFPSQKFVAEDLGLLSPEAEKLRDDIKIPSMAVLQFAFGGDSSNPYLPHNVKRECVYYTGTHDNNTAMGWYAAANETERDDFRTYFRSSGESASWDMIHAVMLSQPKLAVFPMQDVLSLPSECRTNTPGLPHGNWKWRMTLLQLETARRDNAPYIRRLCKLSGRIVPEKAFKKELKRK